MSSLEESINKHVGKGADPEEVKGNVYLVYLWLESGCSFYEGEFRTPIVKIIDGVVDDEDPGLVFDEIQEHMEEFIKGDVVEETFYKITIHETGEQEDYHWNKYYKIVGVEIDTTYNDDELEF